ncbi:HipA domain-containing protein [Pusillimonas sp. MFBS29]|uniref:type II toxin-antitoxin system HipA family toxin n=1 Tax=Pusillimonas sp. MFBS29 TaxID=2886690 RepID=UPI001D11953D|nr:HipA domain-containing protein [Pusillimonas sp. MFBS29]MCC2597664.1 HipA domain-containing protein [Pusillimonas sp. MFBS29]
MTTSIKYLRMYLHQPAGDRRAIGYLSQYGDILRVSFDDDYVNDPERPLLSLSYQGTTQAATREILTSMRDARLVRNDGRLPVFFQNLLPEGHNRERLAHERGCAPDDEFELLAAAGHDLMGALEVEPVAAELGVPDTVRHWHTALGLDVLESGFVEMPVEDAASLPGAVTKFSAVQDGRRYVVKRRGQAGSYILKLPSSRHADLVENEYTCYRLCAALDLDCASASVISRADADLPENLPFDHILAVARFDRGPGGQRIHMEEFAQALQYEPRHKYGKDMITDYAAMLRVLDKLSGRPAQDIRSFVERLVAFMLMGNTDAHLKNWALIYPDGRTPQLAPVYDPVCVTALFDSVAQTDYGINRAIDRWVRQFSWNDLESLLAATQVMRPGRYLSLARQVVRRAQAVWPALLKDGPPSVQRAVQERLDGGLALTAT